MRSKEDILKDYLLNGLGNSIRIELLLDIRDLLKVQEEKGLKWAKKR